MTRLAGECLCGNVRFTVESGAAHIYAGSKAPWHDITDGLPQHHELP